MNAFGPALERTTEEEVGRLFQTAAQYGLYETFSREDVRDWQVRSAIRWRNLRERIRNQRQSQSQALQEHGVEPATPPACPCDQAPF